MLLALPRRKWVADNKTDYCNDCCVQIKRSAFSSNKHHCRFCGNIVCAACSTGTFQKKRICDSCSHVQAALALGAISWDSDADDEIEELSPYNTPMLKFKEFSAQNSRRPSMSNRSPDLEPLAQLSPEYMEYVDFCEFQDTEIVDEILPIDLPQSAYNAKAHASASSLSFGDSLHSRLSSRELMRCDSAKSCLVSGFVRACWRNQLQFAETALMSVFPSEPILYLLAEWLTVSDCFDEYSTDLSMIQYTKPLSHLKEYRRVTTVERIKDWNFCCSHSFGYDVVCENGRAVWKFKLSGHGADKPCVLIGVVEANQVSQFMSRDQDLTPSSDTFSSAEHGGYALHTVDWMRYHADDDDGRPFAKDGELEITPNDVLAVELDLTHRFGMDHRCGRLKFVMNGHTEMFENGGVAFDDIDIRKDYRLAIGMYLKGKVAMYQVL